MFNTLPLFFKKKYEIKAVIVVLELCKLTKKPIICKNSRFPADIDIC